MKIKRGDMVVVVAGDDRSDIPKPVQQVLDNGDKVVVEGVNLVYKHVKRGHPKSPQGGRLHVELPIDASNVQLICPETNKPTRIGVKVAEDGSKILVAKRSGATLRQIAPARKKA